MRANFGEHFKLTIFGESHGPAIGVVVDGLPAGRPQGLRASAPPRAGRSPQAAASALLSGRFPSPAGV